MHSDDHMNIYFTGQCSAIEHGINFQAIVDGNSIQCYVSNEALQNISVAPKDTCALTLFIENRAAIESIAEKMIRARVPAQILMKDVQPA